MSLIYNFAYDPPEPKSGRLINGRRWHEPGGTKYILAKQNYKEHLLEIKERLEHGPVLMINEGRDNMPDRAVQANAFAIIRMVMPSIETVARAQGISQPALLSLLNVPAPNLIWNLFRDTLSHNDAWMRAKVRDKVVRPMILISLGGSAPNGMNMHRVNHHTSTHALDIGNLCFDLIEYLEKQIADAPKDKEVEVIDGIEYLSDAKDSAVQQIIHEIDVTEEVAKQRLEWFWGRLETKMRWRRREALRDAANATSTKKDDKKL